MPTRCTSALHILYKFLLKSLCNHSIAVYMLRLYHSRFCSLSKAYWQPIQTSSLINLGKPRGNRFMIKRQRTKHGWNACVRCVASTCSAYLMSKPFMMMITRKYWNDWIIAKQHSALVEPFAKISIQVKLNANSRETGPQRCCWQNHSKVWKQRMWVSFGYSQRKHLIRTRLRCAHFWDCFVALHLPDWIHAILCQKSSWGSKCEWNPQLTIGVVIRFGKLCV